MKQEAKTIFLKGIVQGIGFRPFVYKLAQEMGIKGWINNSGKGVTIHAEGKGLDRFYERLITEAPPLAKIVSSRVIISENENYKGFEIVQSKVEQEADVFISPDIATCEDCLGEMSDIANQRYKYPFINCTNCGPRYTIIRDVPYDRAQTTMSDFPMCQSCELEYQNPRDRRFHAQPTACPECGPKVQLMDAQGHLFSGIGVEELEQGAILAIKGLGGFHFVCDARNKDAVRRLRERKERGAKPFALMARSVETAHDEVFISLEEERLLRSTAAPIVILERKVKLAHALPEEIAPGIHTLGIMLPYTPIHHLLFEGSYDFLVMTSANLSGRPLIYKNDDALEELKDLADYFLIHDRDIYHPCDDSVVQFIGGETVFLRRARGYVPLPILMRNTKIRTPMLAVGGDLKNTFCLATDQRAFVSQYLGDMEGFENLQRFHQELESFQKVVNITTQSLAYDNHPNYQMTRFALEQPLPKHSVQHHHAHFVSVLGEWDRLEPAFGIICDGTGFGEDGCSWGFEVLYGNAAGFERKGHLEYLPLPGGDAGAKHPVRIAYAYLKTLLEKEEWEQTEALWRTFSLEERKIIDRQLETGIQIFQTSSAGRLFDAVSGLLGVCQKVTYEGQAAIELESLAVTFAREQDFKNASWHDNEPKVYPIYPFEVIAENSQYILKVKGLLSELVGDLLQGVSQGEIAYRFHMTIAQAIVELAIQLRVGKGPLVLSGGVFQNKLLTEAVLQLCQQQRIEILRSRTLPPGDGGLAFGQLLIANEVL